MILLINKIINFLTFQVHLGTSTPARRWNHHIWTKEDHDNFYKKFEGRIKEDHKK